nr:hypothetical protein [Candidatus Krumholzibacteria bacterium]
MNTPHSLFRALRRVLVPALTLALAGTALAAPGLTITPTRVQPGETVLVTFSDFSPGGYNATLLLDDLAVTDIFVPSGGSGSFSWTLPADLSLGGHDVILCANCYQFEFEERTNRVRLTVTTGELSGNQFNLQPWAIEVTQGVRGDIPMRSLPDGGQVLPEDDVVHVANRRTVVRVYPFVEGGPDFTRVYGVQAELWASVGGVNYGPLAPEDPWGVDVYAAGTMEDLRYSLRRSWNFVLPSEITELARDVESGTFSLTVNINPNGPDQKPECNTCYDDNTANLYSNRFEHVGLGGDQALTLKPYFVEARVFKDDGTTLFMPRPTAAKLADVTRSMQQVMPVADGQRGIRLRTWRNVDWSGTEEEEGDAQDRFLIRNYLPSGELRAAPPNEYHAFLYDNPNSCGGHAYLFSPFLRTGVCGAPQFTAAHELIHAIGSEHAGNGHGEDGGGGYDLNYPGNHGQVEDNTWGLDVYNLRVYPPSLVTPGDNRTHCLMSYGGNKWISRYTWNRVATNLGSPDVTVNKASGLPAILAENTRADLLGFVAFRGLMDSGGTLELDPFLASYPITESPGDGTYELVFRDDQGVVLSSHLPRLVLSQDGTQSGGLFAESVPLPVGWAEMRLLQGGIPTQTWQRSAHPPTVSITSPASGFQWPNSGEVTLAWNATDLDGDDLTYRVFALHISSNELITLGNDLSTPSLVLDRAGLPAGGNWALLVEASDGLDPTYSAFATGFVEPIPPQVLIIQPADNSVHVAGTKIPASGLAMDLQGEISPGNMIWNLDGNYVGSGVTFDVPGVAAGNHVLTLTVYNALQIEGSYSINLQVVSALDVPELTAPADGATGVSLPADLSWTPVPGAISYRVQVAADPSFNEIVAEIGNLGDPRVSFPGDPASDAYHWRVMAEHGAAPSDWSLARSFMA